MVQLLKMIQQGRSEDSAVNAFQIQYTSNHHPKKKKEGKKKPFFVLLPLVILEFVS